MNLKRYSIFIKKLFPIQFLNPTSTFCVNKHDKQSTVRRVPFGARVDTSRLCQFVSLAAPPKNLTRAIIVTEMQKEAYDKDKINIDEYFREIFPEVNVTKRAAKFLKFQKFPAQTFDQFPSDLKGSLGWWAFENNVTKFSLLSYLLV